MLINSLKEYEAFVFECKKADWEQARMITSAVINTSYASKNDKRQMLRSLELPWDKENEKLSNKEIKQLKEKSDRLHGRHQ